MFCPECGEDAGEAKFCPECGADLSAVRTARDRRAGGAPTRPQRPRHRQAQSRRHGTGSRPARGDAGGRPARGDPGADLPVRMPRASGGRGISPVTLWVIVGVVAAIAVAAVLVFSGNGGSSKGTQSGNAGTSAGQTGSVPPVADTSGTYAQLGATSEQAVRPGRAADAERHPQ